MSEFNIVMPKLGESIQEATITKWFVKEGDKVAEDDNLFEVATDKVDSEIPSPVEGTVVKVMYPEGSLLPVGQIVAIINTNELLDSKQEHKSVEINGDKMGDSIHQQIETSIHSKGEISGNKTLSNRFYSPLVKNIAQKENVSFVELEMVKGSGINGRVQKKDILNYLENKNSISKSSISKVSQPTVQKQPVVSIGTFDQVIEMDRVRKLIANHMVMSKQVSAHVTTVVEADVTNLVIWREKNKELFQIKYGEKLTYMHIFTEATALAITEYPLLNSSVDGEKIIIKKNINIGIAVAKPDGNLIVPVVRDAGQKNLVGLVVEINRLADAARINKLIPDEIQGGTFTITNFGSFRNIIGTPIINQPQVAILATGSIEKKPAVLETPTGDVIAIRHKMYLSLSYDHRIIDGALGGSFLRRVADILEQFSLDRNI
jgi:2-oxoglutarate dehydrogenase E2 component (dihydrolipoamide succinyltransferase)